ncbi:MAG: DNA repair protein RadA [bacterium]
MSKKADRTIWVCKDCGGEHLSWSGKCNYCGSWNSLSEVKDNSLTLSKTATKTKPISLSDVKSTSNKRIKTFIDELDLVLGGGIVGGSVLLFGGSPGIGKSTLIWQLATKVKGRVCYVAGEESPEQIKIRSERIGKENKNIFIFDERNIDSVIASLGEVKPELVVVDSIQTVLDPNISGTAGNVVQVRSCTLKLIDYARKNSVAIIIIGHVTKEGEVAGPKTLEHLVDGVFYLEGSGTGAERFLRAAKNRFGTTDEIGIFEMTSSGLKPEPNFGRLKPDVTLPDGVSRSAVIEGSRIIFLEIQALVQKSPSMIPRRNAVGLDINRVHMIAAIISKHLKTDLSGNDIFVNISEGYRLKSTMADVAIAMAIISSIKTKSLSGNKLYIGELDLSGGIHLSEQAKKIIKVAQKGGFSPQYKYHFLQDIAL